MKAFVLHVYMRHSHLPGGGLASNTLIHMQTTSLPFHNQEKDLLLVVHLSFFRVGKAAISFLCVFFL